MFPKTRLYVSYRQGSWDKFFCEDKASQEHTHTLFTHMNCSMPACVCVLTYIHPYTQKYIRVNPTFIYTHECIHTYIHTFIILVLICYMYIIYMLTYLIWRYVISQLLIIYHYPLFYPGFSSKNGFFLLPSVILQSPLGLCLWKVIIL